MNDTPERAQRESIILRVLWMLVFWWSGNWPRSSSAAWCWCS